MKKTNAKVFTTKIARSALAIAALALLAAGILAVSSNDSAQGQVRKPAPTGLTVTAGSEPGELAISWDEYPEAIDDYRVSWTPEGEAFTLWTDHDWNAYPVTNSYIVTGLDPGATYDVKVRARFASGPRGSYWSDLVSGQATEEEQTPDTSVVEDEDTSDPQPDYSADRVFALGIDIQNNFNSWFYVDRVIDGKDVERHYYNFEMAASRQLHLELRRLDRDADLYLEDAHGNVLASSENSGTTNEDIDVSVPGGIGTEYFVRVEAKKSGDNDYRFRAKVSAADSANLVTIPETTPTPSPATTSVEETEETSGSNGQKLEKEQTERNASNDACTATATTACSVSVPGSYTGEIDTRDDKDWIKVTLEAGKSYFFEMLTQTVFGSNVAVPEGAISLRNSSGNQISGASDTYGNHILSYSDIEPKVVYAPSTSGTYYVQLSTTVKATSFRPARDNRYRLRVKVDDALDSTATTATVAVGGSTTGTIQYNGDVDWFGFEVEKSKRYQIDVKGVAYGHGDIADPRLLGIYDSDGNLEWNGNEDAGYALNAKQTVRTYTYSTAGTYYISVTHGLFSKFDLGKYEVYVTDVTNGHPDDYRSSTSTNGVVSTDGTSRGEIDFDGDVDWFKITMTAGDSYRIAVEGEVHEGTIHDINAHRKTVDLNNPEIVGLYNSSGNLISDTARDNFGGDLNPILYYTATYSGAHYIAVRGERGAEGWHKGTYKVVVGPCHPSVCN